MPERELAVVKGFWEESSELLNVLSTKFVLKQLKSEGQKAAMVSGNRWLVERLLASKRM